MSSEYYKKSFRSFATLFMAALIVILLLFNVRAKAEYELKVKSLEEKVMTLDEELIAAQESILDYLESSDLSETLLLFNQSQQDLGNLVKRIDDLTEQLGE